LWYYKSAIFTDKNYYLTRKVCDIIVLLIKNHKYGNDKLAFACGFLPVYDGLPKIRNKNILDVLHLFYTRKYYPSFAEGDLQNIKGVAYKKYFSPSKNKTSFYTIPFNGSTYIYADMFEKNTLQITVGEKIALIEKSDGISYVIENGVLKLTGDRGFAVFICE
jgi:hypothetical protein